MQIAVIGDTHYGTRNDHGVFLRNSQLFLENVFFETIKQRGITHCWHLGDLFDRRKYVNFKTLYNTKLMFMQPAEQLGLHIDLTVGNHDMFNKNNNAINSPRLLAAEYDNIDVVQVPEEKVFDGVKVLFVPWICPDNFELSMQTLKSSKARVAAGHLELQGFEMNMGRVNEVGFQADIFEQFEMVLSGHYHHKSTKGNINYLGSPQQFTWADYGDQKGFHIFDTETMQIEFIKNPYQTFKKVWYDDSFEKYVSGDITDTTEEQLATLHDCYVKLIAVNKTNSYQFDVVTGKIEDAGPCNLTIDDGIEVLFDTEEDLGDVEDTMVILQKYITMLETSVNKKTLESFMVLLYNSALAIE